MARTKEEPADDEGKDDELGSLSGDEREVLSALVELDTQNDVRWKITRIGARDPEENGYCATLTSAELTLEALAELFPAGQYTIQGNRPGGQYVRRVTIRISKSVRRQREEPKPATAVANKSVDEQIALMKAERAEERKERTAMMLQIAGIAAPIIAAMVGRPQQDLASLVTALRPPERKESSLDDFVKLAGVVKDLAGDGGGDKGGTTAMDLVGKGIEALPAVFAGLRGGVPTYETPSASSSPTPTPRPALPTPQPSAAPPSEQDMLLQLLPILRQNLKYLAQQASRNKDVALYADWFRDQVPDDIDPQTIRDFLARDNWFMLAQQLEPGIAPYAGWFGELRDELLRMDWTTDEEPPASEPSFQLPKDDGEHA